MNNIYVTVDSGESPDYSEKYRISDVRNKLSAPIKLEHGMHKVALVECSLIHSAKVIERNQILFNFKIFDRNPQGKAKAITEKVNACNSVYDEDGLIFVFNDSPTFAIRFRKYKDSYIELLDFETFDMSIEFSDKLVAILRLQLKALIGFDNVIDEYSDEETGEFRCV
jgi:hypothetical protein